MGKKTETKTGQPAPRAEREKSKTTTGLSAARITRAMRAQLGRGRIARQALEVMRAREQEMCNYLLDKCVAQMKPLAEGSSWRRIKNWHIAAALAAEPELAALFGVSARLLKNKRIKPKAKK